MDLPPVLEQSKINCTKTIYNLVQASGSGNFQIRYNWLQLISLEESLSENEISELFVKREPE
jgi:hypothetical protein